MPTLDALLGAKKMGKKSQLADSAKPGESGEKKDVSAGIAKTKGGKPVEPVKAKEEAKKPPMNSLEMIENKILTEENKKKKFEKSFEVNFSRFFLLKVNSKTLNNFDWNLSVMNYKINFSSWFMVTSNFHLILNLNII